MPEFTPAGQLFGDLCRGALDHLLAGGTVMLPLAAVSLLLWFLVIYKLIELMGLRRGERSLRECLARGDGSEWQRGLIERFSCQRIHQPGPDRRLLSGMRQSLQARVERFVTTILVLASLAPLLGLLGTVSGMIATFDAIAVHGTGNVRALATGISTALITTQTGLIIAVPGLVLGNFIRRRAEQTKARMERFCLELLRSDAGQAAGEPS